MASAALGEQQENFDEHESAQDMQPQHFLWAGTVFLDLIVAAASLLYSAADDSNRTYEEMF